MSQFVAANVASAALVSSNPTNVLIAGVSRRRALLLALYPAPELTLCSQAWGLNFLTGFTAYTVLPAAVTWVLTSALPRSSTEALTPMPSCTRSALVAYPLLLFLFTFFHPSSSASSPSTSPRQRYIPSRLLPPDVDPRSALVDPPGAVFHASLMLVTLGTLVGTSFLHDRVQVWMVTAPAGVLAFLRDVWSERHAPKAEEEIELEAAPTRPVEPPPVRAQSRKWTVQRVVAKTCRRFPTTTSTVSRLPLSLLPFAGGIFVLARALTATGWTDVFATWLVRVCVSPAATVFFVGCAKLPSQPTARQKGSPDADPAQARAGTSRRSSCARCAGPTSAARSSPSRSSAPRPSRPPPSSSPTRASSAAPSTRSRSRATSAR